MKEISKTEKNDFINKNSRFFVIPFFILLLLTGLLIYKDYGVHYDEGNNQEYGIFIERTIQDFFCKMPEQAATPNLQALIHGPVFEIFLLFITKYVCHLTDSREIILLRHLLVFASFFIGTVFFYFLCKYIFKSRQMGLLGVLFFVLNPKIFPHAFYNSIDIPFLSFYVISIYTLVKFLDKKNDVWMLFHALASAILIDIRLIGLVIPVATVCFMSVECLFDKEGRQKCLKALILYLALLGALVILFWPFLWKDTINNFFIVFKSTKFEALKVQMPWDYTFYWILVTTPPVYLFFFLMGLIFSIKVFMGRFIKMYEQNRNILIAIFLFFVPILLPIILNTNLYNEWRHHFFVYAPFVLIVLVGLRGLSELIQTKLSEAVRLVFVVVLAFIVSFPLISMVCFMITVHPWESSYRNIIYKYLPDQGKLSYENKLSTPWDYWHLAYKNALEYILDNDKSSRINIYYHYGSFEKTCNYAWILPKDQRERVSFVNNPLKAKYLLGNHLQRHIKWFLKNKPAEAAVRKGAYQLTEYYSLKFNDSKLVTVFKFLNSQ